MNQTTSIPGVIISIDDQPTLPRDWGRIAPWVNLIRSLSAATAGGSYAIVRVAVIVDENGRPRFNTRPQVTRIEPKADCAGFEELLESLV